jgi:N-acetyl-gamma-glutamyl-phosphate reductase
MKVGVSIVGGSGYTGAELLRILRGHEKVEINHVTSRELAGTPVSERLVNLAGTDLEYEMPEPCYPDSEVVFVCVHHTSAMAMVPGLLEKSKVVDFYPTGAILALAPLVKEGGIDLEKIVIDSKSGTSGAGKKPTDFTHHPEVASAVRPYKVTDHRHVIEIDQELSLIAGTPIAVNFTPHLIPIPRGIITTCHTFPADPDRDFRKIFGDFYADEPFVRIWDDIPDLRGVIGSNYCDIGLELDRRTGRLVVVSAIDNLTKGASGQAVQNMNIMMGIPETKSLEYPGIYP